MIKISRHVRIFVAFNICLAFWHIFQHNVILNICHQTQQLNAQCRMLTTQKQELYKTLYALRSPQTIHEFAQQQAMHTLRLHQIHTVPHDQQPI